MTPTGFSLVVNWGFWALGFGILLIVAIMWCYDVNRKLNFILTRMFKGKDDIEYKLITGDSGGGSSRPVSPVAAIGIIAGAVFILFILPLWIING